MLCTKKASSVGAYRAPSKELQGTLWVTGGSCGGLLQVPSDAAPAAPDGNGMLGGRQGQCVAPAGQRTHEVKTEADGTCGSGSGCTLAKLVELERSHTRPPAGTLLIVRDMHNPTM